MIADNSQANYAVLTGDLVKSAKLDPVNLKIILQRLQEGQDKFGSVYTNSMVGRIAIFSGDSWQVLMKHKHLSLRAALYFRAMVIAAKGLDTDTRIAVAWGRIDEETLNPENISESTGEAFTLSGRALAEMGRSKYLAMEISKNLSQSLHGDLTVLPPAMILLDEISSRWTEKQAEAMTHALLGTRQNQIARELNIVPSTVNKGLNAAGWKSMKEYLDLIEIRLKGR